MSDPLRLQRRRTPGFRLPPNTICCSRPGPYGNPFAAHVHGVEKSIDMFRGWVHLDPRLLAVWAPRLRGHNLACWCRLCPEHAAGKPLDVICAVCAPCHVDVIGRLVANG